jgi:hypothetical protein
MYDLFDPRDGLVVRRVRFAWLARLVCRLCPTLDFAPTGEGWLR